MRVTRDCKLVKYTWHNAPIHYFLPLLIVSSSCVQFVLNFGSRIAAATSWGYSIIGPKRSSMPTCKASTSGLQYFSGSLILFSLMFSLQNVSCLGDWSHDSSILWQECKFSRIKPVMKTKHINNKRQKKQHCYMIRSLSCNGLVHHSILIILFNVVQVDNMDQNWVWQKECQTFLNLHWNLQICAENSHCCLSLFFHYPEESLHSHEHRVPPCCIRSHKLEGASIFHSFSCCWGSWTLNPKCIALAKCWVIQFLVCVIGHCLAGICSGY